MAHCGQLMRRKGVRNIERGNRKAKRRQRKARRKRRCLQEGEKRGRRGTGNRVEGR